MNKYLAEFYAGIPADGDRPLWSVPISASGLQDATEVAAIKAQKAGISDGTYMIVRRTTDGPTSVPTDG